MKPNPEVDVVACAAAALLHKQSLEIEALTAERDALKDRVTTLSNYHAAAMSERNHLEEQRDALKAKLAALEDQKPVAYGWLTHDGVYDTICPEEHARHEGKYTVPLFTAAGAKPAEQCSHSITHVDWEFLKCMNCGAIKMDGAGNSWHKSMQAAIDAKERP